ncbi:DivIVA domain-containing protein [Actinokineospora iranica]|uniref:Cell wall synthesis protein Wag31 n=1 Tax=Actinokineospora iranica TaxID=1271860 RepID=A0A1G6RGM2_9PSEU|nr:DivIVA domain-containing protein [Actinokineospora iranica]SDD03789.1 DivIVA domain-containing protein [Actinokineospora iranica]
MPLSPKVVREVTFDKAPFGRRGYHEDQVDAFLDRIEDALAGGEPLTAQEVREVVFDAAPLVKRGYHEEQVDEFLDTIAVELEARERAKIGKRVPIAAPRKPVSAQPAQIQQTPQTPPTLVTPTATAIPLNISQPAPPAAQEPAAAPASPDFTSPADLVLGPGATNGHGARTNGHAPAPGAGEQAPAARNGHSAPASTSAPHEIIDPSVPFLPLPPAPADERGYRAVDVERLAHLLTRAAYEKDGGPTAKQIANAPLARTMFDGQGYHPGVIDTVVAAWVDELRRRRSP